MRKPALVLSILIVLAGLGLSAGVSQFRRLADQFPRHVSGDTLSAGGVVWRKVFGWDFSRGSYPAGWGWGEWRLRNGVLEGHGVEGLDAVYIVPFEHGGDFLLETEVRLVRGEGGKNAEAHLLTRDSAEIHHESGASLIGGEARVRVRHRENRKEHLVRFVPLPAPLTYGEWHRLEFALLRGQVLVRLDGKRVFLSDDRWPVGVYGEPHLSARTGIAQFRDLNIYSLP